MQVIPTLALGWRAPARLLFHPGLRRRSRAGSAYHHG